VIEMGWDKGSGKGADDRKGGDVAKWSAKLAKNDAKHGRGSKSNPNNKPNGK
jgi:hypothetical protein